MCLKVVNQFENKKEKLRKKKNILEVICRVAMMCHVLDPKRKDHTPCVFEVSRAGPIYPTWVETYKAWIHLYAEHVSDQSSVKLKFKSVTYVNFRGVERNGSCLQLYGQSRSDIIRTAPALQIDRDMFT